MAGVTDLDELIARMSPRIADDEYVFCSFENARYGDHASLDPVAAVEESEGLTLVVSKSAADNNGLRYDSAYRRITLQVHSSLDAVGLTAAFADELSRHGISANVIAGYYHDHIYVQGAAAEKALEALQAMSNRAPDNRDNNPPGD